MLMDSTDPDQMPYNMTSDQGLHCLLTECSIKTGMKTKNATQLPKNWNWTCPFDKVEEVHLA